jgi:hypothetical protein
MKIASFRDKELKFTASLYTYTVTTDASGGEVRNYALNRTISFNAVTGNFGKIDVFFSESDADIRSFDQLTNLTGPDGNEMMLGAVYVVELIAPFINIWGHREGFRARISYMGYQSGSGNGVA